MFQHVLLKLQSMVVKALVLNVLYTCWMKLFSFLNSFVCFIFWMAFMNAEVTTLTILCIGKNYREINGNKCRDIFESGHWVMYECRWIWLLN